MLNGDEIQVHDVEDFGYESVGPVCQACYDARATDTAEKDEEDEKPDNWNDYEAFWIWFDETVIALDDCENEAEWNEKMKKWCDENNHEMREDGVYNMNIV